MSIRWPIQLVASLRESCTFRSDCRITSVMMRFLRRMGLADLRPGDDMPRESPPTAKEGKHNEAVCGGRGARLRIYGGLRVGGHAARMALVLLVHIPGCLTIWVVTLGWLISS